jgi:fatty acid desaturase
MSKTMDEKLQEQIDAPTKRRAKAEAEAKETLDKFMSWIDKRIEEERKGDQVFKIVAGIICVVLACVAVYSLGIYIAASG